ncbi:hypothetical protein [Streptomyces celluloflavus]|uniref:hypothetical protein n=1 Tax=Streptomyces celluloflavus TaxID=58344 RepID=UPI003665C0B4
MAELVRVRRLTDQEGRKPLQIVRHGSTSSVRCRRATMDDVDQEQGLVFEDLTREQVLDRRNRVAADRQIVHGHIERYGEQPAQRLFTRAFVATVQRLSGLGPLHLGYTWWGQA